MPLFNSFQKKSPIVLIDPAGHAKNPGRIICGGYERGETLKCAEMLQRLLQKKFKKIRFILSRTPGETIVPLQLASFANRLQVDFYVRIQMYKEESVKPKVYVYHHLSDPLVDCANRVFDPFTFVSVHHAHRHNIHTTKERARKIKNILDKDGYQKHFDCFGPFGIPLKEHVGIIAPAITIELGIEEENKWRGLINPLIESLSFVEQL